MEPKEFGSIIYDEASEAMQEQRFSHRFPNYKHNILDAIEKPVSVKNETHKYEVFILVGASGTCGKRKSAINNSILLKSHKNNCLLKAKLKNFVDIKEHSKKYICA